MHVQWELKHVLGAVGLPNVCCVNGTHTCFSALLYALQQLTAFQSLPDDTVSSGAAAGAA